MPKPNTYVQLMNAKQQIAVLAHEVERMKGFTLQQSLDMALITLHNSFGFGPDRCAKFEQDFRATFMDYAQRCVDDSHDDDEIVYTQECLDRDLRAACGEGILPFRERYSDKNLYLRTRDIKEVSNK